jgi:hypothetical protein
MGNERIDANFLRFKPAGLDPGAHLTGYILVSAALACGHDQNSYHQQRYQPKCFSKRHYLHLIQNDGITPSAAGA